MISKIKNYLPYLIFGVLALIIIFPFLSHGYILTLDMVFARHFKSENLSPVFMFIKFLNLFLPGMIIQKIILFSIFFLSGVSMYFFINVKNKFARYFSGLFYMINPFVYFRFLAGQWSLLLAYAVFPFVVRSIIKFMDKKDEKGILIMSLYFIIINFQLHFLILSFIFLIIFLIYEIFTSKEKLIIIKKFIKLISLFLVIFLLINSYWIFSFVVKEIEKSKQLTLEDYSVFDTRLGTDLNKMTNSAMLYGFWRSEAYLLPTEIIPAPIIYVAFIIILFLTINGIITSSIKYKIPLIFLGLASLIFAAGMSNQFMTRLDGLIFSYIPLMKAFREPNKFTVVVVLLYSYFSGFAISNIFNKKNKKNFIILFIVLTIPFIYTITLFNSFWNQLELVDYPDDWYEINKLLNQDDDNFNILFLPWHMYMDFSWNPKQRISNPANIFFDKPVIQGDNMEVGDIYSQSTNIYSRYIELLLDKKKISSDSLSKLNTKYVILAKEVDYKSYMYILYNSGLEIIRNESSLYLLKNKNWI